MLNGPETPLQIGLAAVMWKHIIISDILFLYKYLVIIMHDVCGCVRYAAYIGVYTMKLLT